MKRHVLWLALAVAAFVVVTAYLVRRKPPARVTPQPDAAATSPGTPRFAPPAGNQAAPKQPVPEIPIQDGKTIDFSKGLPIVTDTENDKAIMETARKEIATAQQGVTFGPVSAPPSVPPPKQEPKSEPPKK